MELVFLGLVITLEDEFNPKTVAISVGSVVMNAD